MVENSSKKFRGLRFAPVPTFLPKEIQKEEDEVRSQIYKKIYDRNLRMFLKSWSVCPYQAFPSKVFVSKARGYPSETPFKCSILALPTKIKLD